MLTLTLTTWWGWLHRWCHWTTSKIWTTSTTRPSAWLLCLSLICWCSVISWRITKYSRISAELLRLWSHCLAHSNTPGASATRASKWWNLRLSTASSEVLFKCLLYLFFISVNSSNLWMIIHNRIPNKIDALQAVHVLDFFMQLADLIVLSVNFS